MFIRLARDCNIPAILPAAFHSLFRYCHPPPALGAPYQEQYISACMEEPPYTDPRKRIWDTSKIAARWPGLTAHDTAVFLEMARIVARWTDRKVEQHCESCRATLATQDPRIAPPGGLVPPVVDLPATFGHDLRTVLADPLICLRYSNPPIYPQGIGAYDTSCGACRRVRKNSQLLALVELWNSFGSLFGLPPLQRV